MNLRKLPAAAYRSVVAGAAVFFGFGHLLEGMLRLAAHLAGQPDLGLASDPLSEYAVFSRRFPEIAPTLVALVRDIAVALTGLALVAGGLAVFATSRLAVLLLAGAALGLATEALIAGFGAQVVVAVLGLSVIALIALWFTLRNA